MRNEKTAIVLGASIGGLLAARALAETFEEVLLLERADLPPVPDARPTVPQGRHAHGLLAGGMDAIDELLPGLIDSLVQRGYPTGDNLRDVAWVFEGARLARGDSGVRGIAVDRPALEHAVRERVLALPNVKLRTGTRATGLVVEGDRVQGVVTARPGGGEERVAGSLVVEASGRSSRLGAWLEEAGFPAPDVDEVALETHYVTRLYSRKPDQRDLGIATLVVSSPEIPRGGIALALGADRWIVSQYALGGARPPTDPEGFLAFSRDLPGPQLHRILEGSEPLGDAATLRFASSVRRRYESLRRFPEGLLVMGDALCSFNPTFGQGITVAAQEALLLRALRAGTRRSGLAREFFPAAARIVDVAWNVAAGRSFTYPGVAGRPTVQMRLSNAYLPRVIARASRDPVVATRFLRVLHLVAPPSTLLTPDMLGRVFLPAAWMPSTHGESQPPPLIAPGEASRGG